MGDLMDKGTDAKEILENKILPLKKGYIGVVNRSQLDIDNRKSIGKAVTAEEQFFLTSPYRNMADRQGSKYLQQVLNKELGNHIRSKVPEIRSHLSKKNIETEAALKALGYEKDGDKDKGKLVYKLVSQFSDNLQGSLDGEGRDVDLQEINHGAIINRKFFKDFASIINEAFEDSTNRCLDKDIAVAVANVHGTRNPLFIPEKAFDMTVQSLISRYETPLTRCVSTIRSSLDDVLTDSLRVVEHYLVLKEEIRRLVMAKIEQCEAETVQHLLIHLKAQKAFMNTRHPDFSITRQSSVEVQQRMRADSLVQPPSNFLMEPSPKGDQRREVFESQKSDPSLYGGNPGMSPSPKVVRRAPGLPPPRNRSGPITSPTPAVPKTQSTMESTRSEVLGNHLIQEQTNSLKRMVNDYLNITDRTIRDMAPKYIMYSLVLACKHYVKEELMGDLMQARPSKEDKEKLVERGDGSKSRIAELLAAQDAIKQAMNVLVRLSA